MSVSKIFAVCFPEIPTYLHCATRRKVAGSIPDGVVGKFSLTWSFRLHMAPAFDSSPNRNEYQSFLLGDKGGGCVGLTTFSHQCANCLEIWEPHPLAILWVCIRPVKGWLYLALPTYFITRWHRPSVRTRENEEEQKMHGCQPLASNKCSLRGWARRSYCWRRLGCAWARSWLLLSRLLLLRPLACSLSYLPSISFHCIIVWIIGVTERALHVALVTCWYGYYYIDDML